MRYGQLPQGLDLRRATTLLHCTLDGYIINWLHFPDRIDLIRESDTLLDTLFGLIASAPSRCAGKPDGPGRRYPFIGAERSGANLLE